MRSRDAGAAYSLCRWRKQQMATLTCGGPGPPADTCRADTMTWRPRSPLRPEAHTTHPTLGSVGRHGVSGRSDFGLQHTNNFFSPRELAHRFRGYVAACAGAAILAIPAGVAAQFYPNLLTIRLQDSGVKDCIDPGMALPSSTHRRLSHNGALRLLILTDAQPVACRYAQPTNSKQPLTGCVLDVDDAAHTPTTTARGRRATCRGYYCAATGVCGCGQ